MNSRKTLLNKDSKTIVDYDELIENQLAPFLRISETIGGDILQHVILVRKVFEAQRVFLQLSVILSKPSETYIQKMLQSTSDAITEIVAFRESNRLSEYINHLSAISEGIPAVGWVNIHPAPCLFIKEMKDASEFYTNRVFRDFKEKGAVHVDWIKAWLALLLELHGFVKKYYKTGLIWNTEPNVKVDCAPSSLLSESAYCSGSKDKVKPAALFSQYNQSTYVNSEFKKKLDDMKTYKNPKLRASSTVAAKETGLCYRQDERSELVKLSTMKLEDNKWVVEFFMDKKDIVISETTIKQTLYIFRCVNSAITVKGKINSIILDNCEKTTLLFNGLISSLDIVNCQNVQVQTLGLLPIVNIDKTDGVQLVLCKESLGVQIISERSSKINVSVSKDTGDIEDGDGSSRTV